MSSSETRSSTPLRTPPFSAGPACTEAMSGKGENSSATRQTNYFSPAASSSQTHVSALSTSRLANKTVSKIAEDDKLVSEPQTKDKLFDRVCGTQATLRDQSDLLIPQDETSIRPRQTFDHASSSNSLPITPATDGLPSTAPSTRPASVTLDESRADCHEVLKLKLQLAHAQNEISKLDQELAHSRMNIVDKEKTELGVNRGIGMATRQNHWATTDDANSDTSEPVVSSMFNRTRGIWGNPKGSFANNVLHVPTAATNEPQPSAWFGSRGFNQGFPDTGHQYTPLGQYRGERLSPDPDFTTRHPGGRRPARYDNRLQGSQQYGNSPYGSANGIPMAPFDGTNTPLSVGGLNAPPGLGPLGVTSYSAYHQQPVGTPLSPHASEFTSKTSWKTDNRGLAHQDLNPIASSAEQEISTDGPTYLPPTEPLNYRRLLDRNVTCNWKYIVDKIVCNNDQQASIFLQQKLKVGTPDQKYDIVEAIVAQAYPLMVNRFGNFLVQRCFEHGTPEQVIKIAEAIRGNTLNLSMDPFGCHVVQKAFDSVPEEYKAIMVHELLRRIPETVIHRYACHVWQKLFELRWTESPPQIMKYVNEALQGMWHEVALGETGSLVVQNIFENCLEEDKRPCIEEVLANIDIVAHGQFGNWCIQHICEHGAPPDRSRAVDHVIRYAAEYSTDQFASKVVEKCLKIGGSEFLGRYLDRVCEGRRDRTRIPLIDIASDQYGNYLVQWILNNAAPQHREAVAAHIRKHMVSLRGSKFGSRVGMLCTNHAVATRPGPGVGSGMGGRMGPGPRFGASSYR